MSNVDDYVVYIRPSLSHPKLGLRPSLSHCLNCAAINVNWG